MLRDVLIQRGLSHREAEVAELVTQGLSNKEVAGKLFVTEKTIKFHLTNIYKKMNVKSRAQLIVWCLPHVNFVDANKTQSPGPMGPPQAFHQTTPTHYTGTPQTPPVNNNNTQGNSDNSNPNNMGAVDLPGTKNFQNS